MNTASKIKTIACTTLGAATLMFVPATVTASDQQSQIVVRSDSAMELWQQRTTARLNRVLSRGLNGIGAPDDAIVQVTFTLDETGKAENLKFYNGEGNWHARSIARRAISRLDTLDDVPIANRQNAKFLANIIFADDERTHDRLAARLDKMEQVRLASKRPDRMYIALGY